MLCSSIGSNVAKLTIFVRIVQKSIQQQHRADGDYWLSRRRAQAQFQKELPSNHYTKSPSDSNRRALLHLYGSKKDLIPQNPKYTRELGPPMENPGRE